MYQNFLVPIDGSQLSQATVEHAVSLAYRLDARVTFFHARGDFGASSDGAVLHAVSPMSFELAAFGNARALLAKAEAAARAGHVNCTTHAVVCDNTHEAILEAATTLGCDVIVMASHGRRGLKGMFTGSVTQKVLQASQMPVLVTAVESNQPFSDEQQALAIIKDEHRSLAAVLLQLQHAVAQVRVEALVQNIPLLRAMLFYIEQFPERLHHPKEEAFLFRLLRTHTAEYNDVIDNLEQQHHEGAALLADLRQALQAFETGDHVAMELLGSAVDRFAQVQLRHMAAEEKIILPAASAYLTNADWREIASVFLENHDPRFGQWADQAFNELFTRILNMTPLSSGPDSRSGWQQ